MLISFERGMFWNHSFKKRRLELLFENVLLFLGRISFVSSVNIRKKKSIGCFKK